MNFDALWEKYGWKPIPGCAGRYILKGGCCSLTPAELLGKEVQITVYHLPLAADPVHIAGIPGGGLISYEKAGGMFLHTLNTEAGFKKKLLRLQIL